MPEQNLIERLDEAIDAMFADRRDHLALVEPELAMLLVVAEDLRALPDPQFKAMLKTQLLPNDTATLPTDYPTLVPYLVVDGASELIDFMKDAFEGVERLRVPRPDGTLMHAEVVIGDSVVELGDTSPTMPKPLGVPLHLYVPDADAVYARALRAGATSLYAPVDQPYGDREGGVQDRWGNHWYIGTHKDGVAPPDFHTVTLGLRVQDAAQLISFAERAFGATELHRTTMPDGSIMHAVVRIGSSVFEAGDAHGQWGPMRAHIHLFVDDPDAVYARALDAGATSMFPPNDTAYGQRMGAVTDAFGNAWFIAKLI